MLDLTKCTGLEIKKMAEETEYVCAGCGNESVVDVWECRECGSGSILETNKIEGNWYVTGVDYMVTATIVQAECLHYENETFNIKGTDETVTICHDCGKEL